MSKNYRVGGGGSAAPTGGTTAPGPSGGPSYGLGQRRAVKGSYYNVPQRPAPKQGAAPNPTAGGGPVMPWDLQASNDEAAANNAYNQKIAGLDAGNLRTEQNFGLSGPWADYASNPYSQAALLQRSYENAQRGTLNSAGMQLYAGSTVNHHNANTHQFNVARDQLQKAYEEAQAKYEAEKAQALNEREGAKGEASWRRIEAGLKEPAGPEYAPGPNRNNKNKRKQKGGRR